MKIMEKFWDVLGLSDPGYDEYEGKEDQKRERQNKEGKEEIIQKKKEAFENKTAGDFQETDIVKNKKKSNLIAWPKGKGDVREEYSGTVSVTVIEPSSFDDAQQIAEYLKQRKPIVVNFEGTDIEVSKRIIDFISGTVYALDGKIQKVSPKIFLCSTNKMDVSYSSSL